MILTNFSHLISERSRAVRKLFRKETYITHLYVTAGSDKITPENRILKTRQKPLWVREHSGHACGFEADRDENAAYTVLKLGLEELGVEFSFADIGLGETESTPAETATASGTVTVPASRVAETGCLHS